MAAQITATKPYEKAGMAGKTGFTLNAVESLANLKRQLALPVSYSSLDRFPYLYTVEAAMIRIKVSS